MLNYLSSIHPLPFAFFSITHYHPDDLCLFLLLSCSCSNVLRHYTTLLNKKYWNLESLQICLDCASCFVWTDRYFIVNEGKHMCPKDNVAGFDLSWSPKPKVYCLLFQIFGLMLNQMKRTYFGEREVPWWWTPQHEPESLEE